MPPSSTAAPHHVPAELPESPIGWKRSLISHLNFGMGKGSGTYRLLDEGGRAVPITHHYDHSSKNRAFWREFFMLDGEATEYTGWNAVRVAWPRWVERRAAAARAAGATS